MIPAVDALSGPGVLLRPLDWRDVDLVMAASRTDVPDWTLLPRDLDERAAGAWIRESTKARIDGRAVRFVIEVEVKVGVEVDGPGAGGVDAAGEVQGAAGVEVDGHGAGGVDGAGEVQGAAGVEVDGHGAVEIYGARELQGAAGVEVDGPGAGGVRGAGVVAAYSSPDDVSVVGTSYFLLPQHRGRGIATAALTTLSAWLTTAVPGLRRLELMVVPGNDASERVALRAGYRRQGVMTDAVPPVNGFPARDGIVYTRAVPSEPGADALVG